MKICSAETVPHTILRREAQYPSSPLSVCLSLLYLYVYRRGHCLSMTRLFAGTINTCDPDAEIGLRLQNLNKFKSMNSIYIGDKEDSGKLGILIKPPDNSCLKN